MLRLKSACSARLASETAVPAGASNFDSMRDEAGISRLYGAIHYRSDIQTGKDHGTRIGGYTVAFARQDGAD